MGPLIRSASLRGFAPLVRELGGEPEALLQRFGLPTDLTGEDRLIPITAHDLMLDVAAEELACPDLGLRLAETQDISILGPLALAIESSATVAEALECAGRYMFVHSPALSITLEPDPMGRREVVALSYRKDLSESAYSPQAIELGMAVLYGVALALLGRRLPLRSVLLPHQPLSPVARYTGLFAADVRFGAVMPAFRVERSVLDAEFAGADEQIRQVALAHLSDLHSDSDSTSTRARRVIAGMLEGTSPRLTSVARLLGVHPRTLQRRLAGDGTTFEALLDDVRREAAHRLVTTTDAPLGQVALMLGFAEQSVLTHAVHRWYGVSPRTLREQQGLLRNLSR